MAHRNDVMPKRLFRRFSAALGAVLGAVLLFAGCATLDVRSYSAESIEAWVVDEQTGQPLEGVVVVADWLLMRGTFGGRSLQGPFMILESVSDAKGRFHFPAWGPRANRTLGFMDHEDPELWFFKPGYQMTRLTNNYTADYRTKPSKRRSDWNSKVIRLKRFEGGGEEYAKHIALSGESLMYRLTRTEDCAITRIPQLAAALDRENTRLMRSGLNVHGFTYRGLLPEYIRRCAIQIPETAAR